MPKKRTTDELDEMAKSWDKAIAEGTEGEGLSPVEVRARKPIGARAMYGMRLSASELAAVQAAAAREGLTFGEFARKAALAAAAGDLELKAGELQEVKDRVRDLADVVSRM